MAAGEDFDAIPHRRFNPLRKSWVLVSPQRTERPWQGETTKEAAPVGLRYDPTCYLCPGNVRAGGKQNPAYTGVFAFDNDYAALKMEASGPERVETSALLVAERERGRCRVICFHPDHSLTLARMQVADIAAVVDAWVAETMSLGELEGIGHVQIFENRGAMMGASNPHPHCQVWATEHVPDEPRMELAAQAEYRAAKGSCLLCDYVATEMAQGRRMVTENEHFVAVVPFWAVWPFEVMVLGRRHFGSFLEMTVEERGGLAAILKAVTVRYDNLFQVSFPYSMGFHQTPTDGAAHPEMHFHAHFYPPLLRSAEIRKFMVGFEMLGMPQRDLTPETAAERLAALPGTHYSEASTGDGGRA